MKQLLILLFVIVLFSNCNNKKGWSLADQQKGLKGCLDEVVGKVDDATGKKYCSCVLEKAMSKYSSYAEAEKGTDADGVKLAQACMKELGLGGTAGGDDVDEGGGKKDGGIFGVGDDDGRKKKLTDDEGGGGNGWSTTDKNGFLKPCTAGLVQKGYSNSQARQLCNCGLEKLEHAYSSLRDADARGGEAAGARVMQECANSMQGDDNDN